MPEFRILDLCDAAGAIREPLWLARAETVHRQLRPDLPADYVAKMSRVCAGGGRVTLALHDEAVAGLALWRCHEDTYSERGIKFYVDDLVTDESQRSQGAGHALIEALGARARALGAGGLTLDSGVQRFRAHAFYFREGFFITAHNFKKQLV
ncbi:MAG: GNAT family N-acetyltransferase [Candidatus Dactylopiibacterium sp.]|nr:GNAT family N-acetyltransferase [Candidatus Dactylopiibacterium sp.]